MDEFFRDALAAWNDPREVVTDPHARYFGTELGERSLVPGDDAILSETRQRLARPDRGREVARPRRAAARLHTRFVTEVLPMPDIDPTTTEQKPRSTAWQTALTMLQEAEPPFIPVGAHAMTVVWPECRCGGVPGSPGGN
jgi:hypothetical protein